MIGGKIFITRSGYDPQRGKHVKDPYLEGEPSLGACRPDVRKQVKPGDFIFTISGKVKGVEQFVMGGFEVDRKIHANEALTLYREQQLHLRPDGQLTGNVVIDDEGRKHPLDQHKEKTFGKRLIDYVVGKNPIVLLTDDEIKRGRETTMDALQEIMKKKGETPKDVISRFGATLTEEQALKFRDWLKSLKAS
jgi:hypothetical protein